MNIWARIPARAKGLLALGGFTFGLLFILHGLFASQPARAPVMGVVSTSAEDQRKDAQLAALLDAAAQNSFDVLPMPTERTQDAQIQAIRALIVYQVDVIVFVPVVESGWDNVMREARAAGIPVIAMDKTMQCSTQDALVNYVGFDYSVLAEQATGALLQQGYAGRGVIELYGTLNAYDAKEMARGSRDALESRGGDMTYSICGDGMRSRGYEVMESLSEHLDKIGYVICHNDAMALGAVDYLRENGREPGKDIYICAFGGGADVHSLFALGDISVVVQFDDVALAEETVRAARALLDAPARPVFRLIPARVMEGAQPG